MKSGKTLLAVLVLLFAALMSLPFLVPGCGVLALVGFVPLLCMERVASLTGTRRVWLWHYSAFVLWNAVTTFWVCNATIGGGLFAIFANSFQMSVIFGLFRFSKKRYSGTLPYVFLMTAWIAWERAYFDAEISWPWLVLGNAFAGDISLIQWYEYTGALGGSLWVWLCNLTVFGFLVSLSDGSWQAFSTRARGILIAGAVILFAAPVVLSLSMFRNYEEKEDPLGVVICQPNIDPYAKFHSRTREEQDDMLIAQMRTALAGREEYDSLKPLLVIAPETFTDGVHVGNWRANRTWNALTSFLGDKPGVNVLYGASSYSLYEKSPSHTARRLSSGIWIESHNSAIMTDGTCRTEIFHKSKLVVAVEKTPWPAVFCPIDDMLGGVMGRCVGQDGITVLNCNAGRDTVKVGCAICYESVYGEYCTGYAKAGAEVLAVITNDSWWGNTPGYRQHLRYSSLRAIETRRSIARCANTGISAFIDQKGVIHDPSPWWEPAILSGSINRNDGVTFFVSHGDIAGKACTFAFVLLLLALFAQFFKK